MDISCNQDLYDVFPESIINLIIDNIPEYISTHYNLPIQYWDNGWKLTKYTYGDVKQIKINKIRLISDAFIIRLDFVLKDDNVIEEVEMSVTPETMKEAFEIIKNISEMLNQTSEKKYESYYD